MDHEKLREILKAHSYLFLLHSKGGKIGTYVDCLSLVGKVDIYNLWTANSFELTTKKICAELELNDGR